MVWEQISLLLIPYRTRKALGNRFRSYQEETLIYFSSSPCVGSAAQAIETAVLTSRTPCLICPIQGRFALPSSALAVGALRESKIPVELLYAPSDNPDFVERLRCVTRAARAFSRIRQSRIGVIGGLFPNLVSCRYDPQIVTLQAGNYIGSYFF